MLNNGWEQISEETFYCQEKGEGIKLMQNPENPKLFKAYLHKDTKRIGFISREWMSKNNALADVSNYINKKGVDKE